MAYNRELAEGIRQPVSGQTGIDERKMFGGLTLMVADRIRCGVLNDDLVVRVGLNRCQAAFAHPAYMPMHLTGKPAGE